MTDKPRSGYGKLAPGLWRWLLRNPVVAVTSHWMFQSLLYMDATERWFKIGLDIILTWGTTAVLIQWLPVRSALLAAFLTAHTLNFLFNGHLWGLLKHYSLVLTSRDRYEKYTEDLVRRVNHEPSIKYAAVYGRPARGQWSNISDLDIRFVRYSGWRNGLAACWFALKERSLALVTIFPLDAYVFDDMRALSAMSAEEPPICLVDKRA